jgi:hypothetical protein
MEDLIELQFRVIYRQLANVVNRRMSFGRANMKSDQVVGSWTNPTATLERPA